MYYRERFSRLPMAVLWYFVISLLGLTLGSYLNSWLWRVHQGTRHFPRRSQCIHCGSALRWFENVPLVSFIVQRGRCRRCLGTIPADYFWVELITAVGFVIVTYHYLGLLAINPAQLFRDLFFTALFIVIFVYDLKYQLIISMVVWAGAAVALSVNYIFLHQSLFSLLLGAAAGGGFFLLQYILSRGKWIGGGDVEFGVLLGVLLGWPYILAALFISYIFGLLVALPLLIAGKKFWSSKIPMGTFLVAGAWVTLLGGNQFLQWYRGMVGW